MIKEDGENAHLLAHSIGGMIGINAASDTPENVSSLYMIAPFLNDMCLPGASRIGIRLLDALQGILPYADKLLNTTGISGKMGHCNHVLQAHSTVNQDDFMNHYQEFNKAGIPAAFVLTGHDEVLGTKDKKHYSQIKNLIGFYLPKAEDRSAHFHDLNHCLNIKGDCPFLKPEDGKDRKRVIENIAGFYRAHP